MEGVLADELVVTVHEHLHVVLVAVGEGAVDDVVRGVVAPQVLHVADALAGEPAAFDVQCVATSKSRYIKTNF